MSQAFMREGDGQSLEDVSPSVRALILFLTKENNGLPITERSVFKNSSGQEIHVMSNGLSYMKDANGRWQVA